MVPKGVACALEIVEDPSFGSLLSFGLAGTATELLGDRAFRVIPVSDRDAAALVRAPRAAPLLDGYNGAEPTDLAAMEDLVRRVGKLAEDLPEVRSLTLEPVLATATGGGWPMCKRIFKKTCARSPSIRSGARSSGSPRRLLKVPGGHRIWTSLPMVSGSSIARSAKNRKTFSWSKVTVRAKDAR
jgi:hypothetical protein